MGDDTTQPPPGPVRLARRLFEVSESVAMRATLPFTPRVAVARLRRRFAQDAVEQAEVLERHAPGNVSVAADVRYGADPDEVLDIYRPTGDHDALPILIWVHGGGWFGGAKEDAAGYFKLLAASGYAVVAVRYSLSPRRRYPTPTRQVMLAIAYLRANANRLRLAGDTVIVGGDSAGGHIAAQVGAVVASPQYALTVGVPPALSPAELRGLVLACGFYDLRLARADEMRPAEVLRIELWCHSGQRDFTRDKKFAAMSVTDHVTAEFPPALITAGNGDPLEPQSRLLAQRLAGVGAELETLFFAADQSPPVPHEYQFHLDTEPAQRFLEQMLSFLERRSGRVAPDTGE